MAGFANQNNLFDLGGLENFVDFGEIRIVGFVTTADDNDDIVVWESIDGNAGGGRVGREIIVVIFDVV